MGIIGGTLPSIQVSAKINHVLQTLMSYMLSTICDYPKSKLQMFGHRTELHQLCKCLIPYFSIYLLLASLHKFISASSVNKICILLKFTIDK